jgi:pSer/pThr/pTyr-binding forkhead associated (FHA) protein
MIANEGNLILDKPRRPARDLIDAVLENMRRNLEPLKYSTLAPSRYLVYLHPSEFARLEGILPLLRNETARALGEELERLNRRSRLARYREKILRPNRPAVQAVGGEWQVEFLPDPDGDLGDGDIVIDSELVLPAQPELGVGTRTRRITTVHAGEKTTTRGSLRDRTASPPLPRFATIVYDDLTGRHSYDVTANSVIIGRGGSQHAVDLQVVSSVDVSREHARLRRDPATGQFFLTDLSSLGTTLNGRHVPRGYDEVDGGRRENGAETPLPDRARIGLAETVFLDFEAQRA